MPALVSSAAYLIIPYPRPIVILIQTLPAVVAKTILPYALPRVPQWRRFAPLLVTLCWGIATFIIDVSPPNVPPWLRILGVTLASFASATGDVFWLGALSVDGKTGLAGWAVGTGLGGVICSVLPYIITVHLERPLRDGLGYVWYLLPLVLASHYLVLPQGSRRTKSFSRRSLKGKEPMKYDIESSIHLLQDVSPGPESSTVRSTPVQSLLRPFVMPLLVAFGGQSIVLPGLGRALAVQPMFETHWTFLAAFGGVFHLGSLTARSAILFGEPVPKRSSLLTMAIAVCGLAWLALFPSASMPILCFPIVWCLGAAVGSLWVKVFNSAVEDQNHDSTADWSFRLGFIGVGESLGMIIGGSAGAMLEASLCGLSLSSGERWCHTTR